MAARTDRDALALPSREPSRVDGADAVVHVRRAEVQLREDGLGAREAAGCAHGCGQLELRREVEHLEGGEAWQ
jgi:hypothetical protein